MNTKIWNKLPEEQKIKQRRTLQAQHEDIVRQGVHMGWI